MKAPEPLSAEFFCVSCRTPFQNAFPLDAEGRCALCRHGLRGFDAAYCFGSYEGVLRELIHLYKYGRIKTLARPLGALLAAALPREERFGIGEWTTLKTGSPVLTSAVVAFDCRTIETKAMASHNVIFGVVEAVRLGPSGPAFVYHDRAYKPV